MARMAVSMSGFGTRKRAVKIRDCGKCGGPNFDTSYRWCITCRALGAAAHAVYREHHRQTGLCTECVEKRKKGERIFGSANAFGMIYMKCDTHLEKIAEYNRKRTAARRELGLCAYGACPVKTKNYVCDYHRVAVADRPKTPPRAIAVKMRARKAALAPVRKAA